MTSCTGFEAEGPDVVYRVLLAPLEKVEVTMTTDGWDDSIYLVTDCDDPAGTCILGSDLYPTGSNFRYCSESGGTYYIICDGYNAGDYGDFTLEVEVGPCIDEGCCLRNTVVYDFSDPNQFSSELCDPTGTAVWQLGSAPEVPDMDCDYMPPTQVLGTIVGGFYPYDAGDRAIIGPVDITDETWCMDLCHYYRTENYWDGGNVNISVNGGLTWTLIYPLGGYPGTLNAGAKCVAGEDAFYGHSVYFVRDCFDLTSYIGSTALIAFDFGSDMSGQEEGWYIRSVKFGTDATAVAPTSWGSIKGMFR
jgi:hypothetical protein